MAPSAKDTEKKPEEDKEQPQEKKEDDVVETPVELSVEDGTLNSIMLHHHAACLPSG